MAVPMAGGHGCAKQVLSVDDAMVLPDGRAELVAHVENAYARIFRSSLANRPVLFQVRGRRIGSAVTDREGRAVLLCQLPEGAGEFTASTPNGDRPQLSPGRVFRWRTDRVAMVVDFDNTIADPDYDEFVFGRYDEDTMPLDAAAEMLRELVDTYQLIYLTGRPRYMTAKTRDWLSMHRFPAAPLITGTGLRTALRQGEFKHETIMSLRERFPSVLIGVGDKQSDAEAFLRSGIFPLILSEKSLSGEAQHVARFSNWRELAAFMKAHEPTLSSIERLEAHLHEGETLE